MFDWFFQPKRHKKELSNEDSCNNETCSSSSSSIIHHSHKLSRTREDEKVTNSDENSCNNETSADDYSSSSDSSSMIQCTQKLSLVQQDEIYAEAKARILKQENIRLNCKMLMDIEGIADLQDKHYSSLRDKLIIKLSYEDNRKFSGNGYYENDKGILYWKGRCSRNGKPPLKGFAKNNNQSKKCCCKASFSLYRNGFIKFNGHHADACEVQQNIESKLISHILSTTTKTSLLNTTVDLVTLDLSLSKRDIHTRLQYDVNKSFKEDEVVDLPKSFTKAIYNKAIQIRDKRNTDEL